MAYSLTQLRTLVLQRADMVNSQFIDDAAAGELDSYINDSYEELWDLLVTTYGSEYFVQVACGTTTASCSAMDLPSDFYKLVAVFWEKSSTDRPRLRAFSFADWVYKPGATWQTTEPRYRLAHNSLIYDPIPDAEYSLEVWYVPQCVRLTEDSHTLKVPAWGEYVIVDAARKCLIKEQSDTAGVDTSKAALIARIQAAAPPRDLGEAPGIIDARGLDEDDHRAWGWR